MIETVYSYLKNKYKINSETKMLLAVSGGIDSMALLHLLNSMDYSISAAHINHSTRNGESDEDQLFLEDYCQNNDIPLYTRKLNYEKLKRGNFQENARIARYSFFNELINSEGFEYIATAHHADDQWETFIMNLNRGSGIQGLKGIFEHKNKIIRPFLNLTKTELEAYQKMHRVPYVEDSSNSEDTYLRNQVRHKITPVIKEVFPNFIKKVTKSTSHLRDELSLLTELVDDVREEVFEKGKKKTKIRLKKINEYKNARLLLYFLLQPYGFDHKKVKSIIDSERTGALFQSREYEILRDRKKLVLRKRTEGPAQIDVLIEDLSEHPTPTITISLCNHEKASVVDKHLLLDPEKIQFPIRVRNWEPGDKFAPAGMKGSKKKIKKYLTDLKLSRFEKENILVAVQGEEIIQVIGHRTAEGYIADKEIGIMIHLVNE